MSSSEPQKPEEQQVVETTTSGDLLDAIVQEAKLGRSSAEREQGKEWVRQLAAQVMGGEMTISSDIDKMLDEGISQLDELISAQLNEVMHSGEFQRLEASWRGLDYLVSQTETSGQLKIKVMNVGKKELLKDLTSAPDFDQSTTFKKIHDEGYGVLGGEPYGVLIGDYEFGRHPEDITLLEKISNVSAAAHAPFLSAASPELLDFDSFTQLSDPTDLEKIFRNDAYIKWNSFRNSEDAKYVGLALPHVLMRLPYGEATKPVEEFGFEEAVDGRDHKKYLWGNAAYALGTRLTEAFAKFEWCAAIRGVEGGGLVQGLPTHTFTTDDGDIAAKCPTELAITDRRENELTKLGFIPLSHYKGTDNAVFMGVQSCHKPTQFNDPDATANAKLSSQIQYTLAVCRFAHFLKAMLRDKVGAYMSRSQCQEFLNKWISNYVLLDDNASQEAKSRFPLREASVEVTEIPGKPGSYRAIARLRPHFQLEEVTLSLRLVARQLKES